MTIPPNLPIPPIPPHIPNTPLISIPPQTPILTHVHPVTEEFVPEEIENVQGNSGYTKETVMEDEAMVHLIHRVLIT